MNLSVDAYNHLCLNAQKDMYFWHKIFERHFVYNILFHVH